MIRKWAIDIETSTVIPVEVIDDISLEYFCKVIIQRNNGPCEKLKWKDHVFPTELEALLVLRQMLIEKLSVVRCSLDKIEEKINE